MQRESCLLPFSLKMRECPPSLTNQEPVTVNLRFREHLSRQLGFIHRSCEAYDTGHRDEAIRIATSIRVLVHDTRSSTSLITHLGAADLQLLSTVPPDEPDESGLQRVTLNGLASMKFDATGVHLVPPLGRRGDPFLMSVDEWWNQRVWLLGARWITRRDIVLAAANKDGGAHVDAELTVEYEELARPGAAGTFSVGGPDADMQPFVQAHLVALRQLGYEILNSVDLIALTSPPNGDSHERRGNPAD